MKIGEQLKKQRELNHWSQQNLADQLHISRQSISKWEQGTALPSFANVVAISDLFNITLDELIRGDEKLMCNLKENQTFTPVEKIVWLSIGIAIIIFAVLFSFKADFNQIAPWLQGIGTLFLIALLFSLDWQKINQALSKKAIILAIVAGVLLLIPYLNDTIIIFFKGLSDGYHAGWF